MCGGGEAELGPVMFVLFLFLAKTLFLRLL